MLSNQVLTGLIKGLKREGKDMSKHKDPVCEEDHQKLYECGVFSLDTPETLQNKIIYELIAHFGRRGREGLQSLAKDSFVFKTDVKGRQYVTLNFNEADKTHHGIDSREQVKEPRMYGTGDAFCPLKSFQKYLSKLNPNCNRFLQRPVRKFHCHDESASWYENAPLGVNKVNSFMSNLSDKAQLSKRYTNHCIRAFVMTHLHQKGFSNQAIMSLTGHRNVQSLTSYIKPHDDEKLQISNALTYNTSSKDLTKLSSATSTDVAIVSAQPQQNSLASHVTQMSNVSNMSNLQTNQVTDVREISIFSGQITSSNITVNYYSK